MNTKKQNYASGTSQNKQQYGLLSMIAMIVGTVIGSGIYVVNNTLYAQSNSIGLSVIAWIVISLVILFMLISFIEISSITSKTGEPGTINNWTRKLWGQNFSRFAGFYFPLIYFPMLITGFSMIASSELMGNFAYFDSITQDDTIKIWVYFIASTLFALLFINAIYGMNMYTTKPGKIVQSGGTIIKLIPLFTLVFIGFIALFGVFSNLDSNRIFDFNNDANQYQDGKNAFVLILLMAPTVMFSYDGFLYAASLSNEAKKPSTYKVAAITGIIFIIFIYILMSIFAFIFGDPSGQYSVTEVLVLITGQKWLGYVISVMIVISVLTGLSAISIAQNRMTADLSANNLIRDENGKLIARNKALVPQRAAFYAWMTTLVVFGILRLFDIASLVAFNLDATGDAIKFNGLAITGWSLGILTVISYSFYTSIIAGGVKNRFTNEVAVDKNKMFMPSSLIAILAIAVIVVIYAGSILTPSDFVINETISLYNITTYVLQILLTILIVGYMFALPTYQQHKISKFTLEQRQEKEKLIKTYREQKVDPRYK